MKYTKTIARLVLGAAYIFFGLNFFFQFLPTPPANEAMGNILGAFFGTGYLFQVIKGIEILCGLLLVTGFFVPLALIVLAPITFNIVLMHAVLDPSGIGPGLFLMLLHIYLGIKFLNYYRPMLLARAS